jgi:hypothetical protein
MPVNRVLVASVAENHALPIFEVELLYRTLRHFAGELSQAAGRAYFVTGVQQEVVDRLSELGVTVEVVEPVDERCPHANKIRMLADGDFEYLVALDTDVVVSRDFSVHIGGEAVGAVPAHRDPLGPVGWERIFEHFGLRLPVTRYRMGMGGSEVIPYFNSVVLVIPRAHLSPLRDSWLSFVHRLLDAYDMLPAIAKHRYYTDQFAFSLALHAMGIPNRALPVEMNCSTISPLHPWLDPERITPYIVHHHHRLSARGELALASHAGLNQSIDTINARLRLDGIAGHRDLPFENWWTRIEAAKLDIARVIPDGACLILADRGRWGVQEVDGGDLLSLY